MQFTINFIYMAQNRKKGLPFNLIKANLGFPISNIFVVRFVEFEIYIILNVL